MNAKISSKSFMYEVILHTFLNKLFMKKQKLKIGKLNKIRFMLSHQNNLRVQPVHTEKSVWQK